MLGVQQEAALGRCPGFCVALLLQAALPLAQEDAGGGGPARLLPQAALGGGRCQAEGLGQGPCGPRLIPQAQEQAAPETQVLRPRLVVTVPRTFPEHAVQVPECPAKLLQLGQAGGPQAQVTGPATTSQDGQRAVAQSLQGLPRAQEGAGFLGCGLRRGQRRGVCMSLEQCGPSRSCTPASRRSCPCPLPPLAEIRLPLPSPSLWCPLFSWPCSSSHLGDPSLRSSPKSPLQQALLTGCCPGHPPTLPVLPRLPWSWGQ